MLLDVVQIHERSYVLTVSHGGCMCLCSILNNSIYSSTRPSALFHESQGRPVAFPLGTERKITNGNHKLIRGEKYSVHFAAGLGLNGMPVVGIG